MVYNHYLGLKLDKRIEPRTYSQYMDTHTYFNFEQMPMFVNIRTEGFILNVAAYEKINGVCVYIVVTGFPTVESIQKYLLQSPFVQLELLTIL